MGGETVKLTATVTNYGILGVKPVKVAFYQGDPKKGGKLLGKRETKVIPGAATTEVTLEWKLAEDVWDHDDAATKIHAFLEISHSANDTKIIRDHASLDLEGIRLDAVVEPKKPMADGACSVEVGIQNSGFPHAASFPIVIYDYAGIHEVTRVMMPRVGAGGFEEVRLELPAGSAGTAAEGKEFLIKVDPENTLKLPGNPKLEKRVRISAAP